jgi:hypothetical protein
MRDKQWRKLRCVPIAYVSPPEIGLMFSCAYATSSGRSYGACTPLVASHSALSHAFDALCLHLAQLQHLQQHLQQFGAMHPPGATARDLCPCLLSKLGRSSPSPRGRLQQKLRPHLRKRLQHSPLPPFSLHSKRFRANTHASAYMSN